MTSIIFCFIYLVYLSLICQTLFIYDSIGYAELGGKILHHGLLGYLQNSPQREPLYPLIVAGAMRLGELFHSDYTWFLKFFQFLILIVTQILASLILRGLGVQTWLRVAAVVYIGISPALVNSTMWVYSEIAALPLVLAVVLTAARAWQGVQTSVQPRLQSANGIFFGLSLASCVFVKDIFEAIAPVLMLPFVWLLWRAGWQKSQRLFSNALIVLLCAIAGFYAPVLGYKALNKAVNGQFAFTDRAGFALYGNTVRRMQPLTAQRLKAALAYAANPHFCYKVADPKDCDFWSYKSSDVYGMDKLSQLQASGMPPEKINPALFRLSIEKLFEHPFQYGFLAFLETLKMPFWETSKAGQVTYPDWLDSIYSQPGFEPLLVSISALLSLLGFIYLLAGLWKDRENFFASPEQSYTAALVLFMVLMIAAYAGAHSFFFVLQRYALPLAPLWIIGIAAWVQRCLD